MVELGRAAAMVGEEDRITAAVEEEGTGTLSMPAAATANDHIVVNLDPPTPDHLDPPSDGE